MKFLKRLALALAVLGTLFTSPVLAREKIEDVVNRAWPSLPPYCHAKLRGTAAEQEYWARTMGPGFIHVHHHCFGLALAMAAQVTTDKGRRTDYLRKALGDYSYVISHSSPRELTIMPQVYLERGKTFMALGDFAKAKADMDMASKISQGPVR